MATNAENSQLKKAVGDGTTTQATPSTGASAAPQETQSRVANYSTGSTLGPSSQGSGRFTNIKNYINANQGAGEQLGSKITNNIQQNVGKTEKEQATQASNIASNIQAEKDRLAQGTAYNTQLQDTSANGAEAINNDETQKEAFQKLATNQYVASDLATQAQSQADAATTAYNTLGTQIGNLGTEQGRFALLQQAVKNPQYTQGQQRLDQLFLQAGNPNQLVQAQRDLGKQVTNSANALSDQYTGLGTDITNVGTQASDVASMLQGTLGSETQNLINSQISEAQGLNTSNAAANAALQTYFTNGYDSLTDDQKAIVNNSLQSGGLTSGMRTYNVLSTPQAYQNYLTTGSTNLTGADVLDQNEYNRYAALAGLAGTTPSVYTQAGAGSTAAGIKDTLGTDISAARAALEAQFGGTALTGGYNTGRDLTANALDLLKYQEGQNYGTKNLGFGDTNIVPIYGTQQYSNGAGFYDYSGNPLAGSIPTNANLGQIESNYAGQQTALQMLLNKYNELLNSAGYGNTLGGVAATTVTPGSGGNVTGNI